MGTSWRMPAQQMADLATCMRRVRARALGAARHLPGGGGPRLPFLLLDWFQPALGCLTYRRWEGAGMSGAPQQHCCCPSLLPAFLSASMSCMSAGHHALFKPSLKTNTNAVVLLATTRMVCASHACMHGYLEVSIAQACAALGTPDSLGNPAPHHPHLRTGLRGGGRGGHAAPLPGATPGRAGRGVPGPRSPRWRRPSPTSPLRPTPGSRASRRCMQGPGAQAEWVEARALQRGQLHC